MLAIIPLKDFVADPEKNLDLSSLPEEEAIAVIKQSFGFFATAIEVSIRDGIATINFPEAQAERLEKGLALYERGVKHAQRGDYKQAISLFKQALEIVPNHTDARRNLAMAYLESGNQEKAKDYLTEVLALDPKDAWAFVLLGNIYFKEEKKLDLAEKFYRRAFELNPNDPLLLANYGALMAEKQDTEQAEEFFERAIQANPTYPNSYHALAVLNYRAHKPQLALQALDDMFGKAKSSDIRSGLVYTESRQLYLEASRQIADESYDRLMQAIDERKQALEKQEGGLPIEIVEDNSLQFPIVSQMAWRQGGRQTHDKISQQCACGYSSFDSACLGTNRARICRAPSRAQSQFCNYRRDQATRAKVD